MNLSNTINGLTENSTYHYRVAVSNALGVSYGADVSFSPVTFSTVPIAGLPGVGNSSVAWGDYDNDGRLDFLLTGEFYDLDTEVFYYNCQLWRNTGSGFINVTASVAPSLPGVSASSVAWGDYDNDGRLDLLLTGYPGVSQLWRNTSSGFTNVTASVAPGLPGVFAGSVAWGDYDNDGRLDFLLTGFSSGSGVSQLWRNTGSGFANVTASVAPGLPQVWFSSVAWGDYDNDGRLDFLLTGFNGSSEVSQLWRNTGSGFADVTGSVVPSLPGVRFSSVAWGDHDNDGRLDFLLTGSYVSQLWRNTGSGFTNMPLPGVTGVQNSSVAWGDYDSDGRLDFLLTGYPGVSQLWRNSTAVTNAPPAALTGLALTATTNAVMFSWNSATDDLTPASGLTYNVRAGTTPGGTDLLASHVNATNGFRRVPAMGNAMLRHSLPLTGLTNGQTVYWSVQAVDTAFAGGPFATETSVVTIPTLFITTNSQPSTLNLSWTPPTWGWFLQETPSLAPASWSNSASGELNPATVPATNNAKFFRLTTP